jgi:hypothetical protein
MNWRTQRLGFANILQGKAQMNPADLTYAKIAETMEISLPELMYMATHQAKSFRPTEKRKDAKGKIREIDPPIDKAKIRFGKLHRFWQKEFRAHSMAHGGVRRRSHFTSARQHLGRRFVISRDLSNCYNSITEEQLRHALLRNGFKSQIAWLLAALFTVHGRIPQGSPVSGDALNEYLRYLDHVLASAAGRSSAGRSRLTDDIVISTDEVEHVEIFVKLIEEQIGLTGLHINAKKRDKKGIQHASTVQDVHGLIVNSKRGTRVNKKYAHDAVAAANEYRERARVVSPETLEALAARRMIITGHMFNCRQAEVSPARELRRQLAAGDRQVLRKLMKVGLGAHRNNWWIESSAMGPGRLSALWQKLLSSSVYVIRHASPLVVPATGSTATRFIICPFAAARLRSLRRRHRPKRFASKSAGNLLSAER